ncbi:MAG TPA: C_GCAxxG_C_C family protein [Anaerolineae bacterium]|nr:C_GCAxxG_C_C family protein [Anaerolineae bacterium]
MLLAVGEHILGDLNPQMARMASGFAGGVGDTQEEMCGALSGGIMIISGLHGRNSLEQDDQEVIDLAARYRERFIAQMGVSRCGTLYEQVHAPNGLGTCALVVEEAARILLELLAE